MALKFPLILMVPYTLIMILSYTMFFIFLILNATLSHHINHLPLLLANKYMITSHVLFKNNIHWRWLDIAKMILNLYILDQDTNVKSTQTRILEYSAPFLDISNNPNTFLLYQITLLHNHFKIQSLVLPIYSHPTIFHTLLST